MFLELIRDLGGQDVEKQPVRLSTFLLHRLTCCLKFAQCFLLLDQAPSKFQLRHDLAGQATQRLLPAEFHLPRLKIKDA